MIRKALLGALSVSVAASLTAGCGWMMGWGSCPYDPHWALNHPKKSCWMALAGPAANLVLVLQDDMDICE